MSKYGTLVEAVDKRKLTSLEKLLFYLSQYLINLMHKICFTISFISCLYMLRAHVLEACRGMK